jgi:predicted enzyme involved in methoxymalonyl-ACP biosynthesis
MSVDPQIPSPKNSEITFDELCQECRHLEKQIEALANRLSDVARA